MRRFTCTLHPDLFDFLEDRARRSHRSISGEISHLIESGIAAESEYSLKVVSLVRQLLEAQENPHPEHIDTDDLEDVSLELSQFRGQTEEPIPA